MALLDVEIIILSNILKSHKGFYYGLSSALLRSGTVSYQDIENMGIDQGAGGAVWVFG